MRISHTARPIFLILALLALAVGASAATAATQNIASDVAESNVSFKKQFGMTMACPDTVTIGASFTCTYTKGGTSASADYIIRKSGRDAVAVDAAKAAAAVSAIIPVSSWIGISINAYNGLASLHGVKMSCPASATSAASILTCTLTSKDRKQKATVPMRFAPTSPFAYTLVPVKKTQFAGALLVVS